MNAQSGVRTPAAGVFTGEGLCRGHSAILHTDKDPLYECTVIFIWPV